MNEEETPSSVEQSGSQSAVPPAQQVTAELDGFTITSASAIAPHTEASLTEAARAAEMDAPEERPTRSLDAEAARSDQPAPAAKPATDKPGPPKKQTAEERIAEMQAKIHATTRELRETERRRDAIREETERLARPPAQAPPADAPSARPRWKAYEDAGKSYIEYEEDLAKWDESRDQRNQAIVEQRFREQQQADQQRREHAAYLARCDDSRAKHPDWDETITSNMSTVPQTPFLVAMVKAHPKGADIFYEWGKNPDIARAWAAYDSNPDARPTRPILSALYKSAQPSAMLEHLALHPEEYRRLTTMDSDSALMALGQLETVLAGAKNGSSARPISHAAAPLSHRAGSQQRGGTASATDDDLDIEDYVRTVNKREGRPSPI